MNIALLGYGKMGKEIESIALQRGHQITLIIDINNQSDLNPESLKKADVAIDFTTPQTAVPNILHCFQAGIPVVCGTTGWHEQIGIIEKACKELNGAFFYTSNFSLGVNVLFHLNKVLAGLLKNNDQYNVSIEEIHHTTKLDKPSGTAISLAKDILSIYPRKKNWELDRESSPESLRIDALRQENVPGTHTVKWESDIDIIQLHHSAKNRKGLALGAVLAAEFLPGKKGIFTMKELLGF
jgi:4-hydroxy-tetrahydrodipicolinate reductase